MWPLQLIMQILIKTNYKGELKSADELVDTSATILKMFAIAILPLAQYSPPVAASTLQRKNSELNSDWNSSWKTEIEGPMVYQV